MVLSSSPLYLYLSTAGIAIGRAYPVLHYGVLPTKYYSPWRRPFFKDEILAAKLNKNFVLKKRTTREYG